MPILPPDGPAVSPLLTAALLLVAIPLLAALGLPHPTVAQVLGATGASRSRAYELRAAIAALLPTILRAPGRPPRAPPPAADTGAFTREILDYVAAHPGAMDTSGSRGRYSDGFRHLVLDLVRRHPALDTGALAEAVRVPAATLRDWLAATSATPEPGQPEPEPEPPDATLPQIESLLLAWKRWNGSFATFCKHVRHHLRLPWGRTCIAGILALHGVRRPRRRPGRSPDELGLRGQFETFFPGAQWAADGTPIQFLLNGEPFTFNVELGVDVCSGAFTGASVRDAEDGQAVVEAFHDGVATTGTPPIALSMDNRFSNHTPEVEHALGDTLKIRATQGRPQNDAHVEGAFGLFQQTAPPLVLHGDTPREIARSALALVVATWGRAVNHRPRGDRRGRSRAELYYDDPPTPEQIAAARAALAERQRRQERAYRTRAARLDPVVRAMLDEACARLGLPDPTGHVRDAIARYPLDAVLAGIATFEGKRHADTLPDGAGAHYLLGIVRNIAEEDEGMAIADALWCARQDAHDRALGVLDARKNAVHGDVPAQIAAFADHALATDRLIDRAFWIRAIADLVLAAPADARQDLHRLAARRIHATHRVHWRDRQAAVRRLAAWCLPL
jgi:hypothetical protein